MTMDHEVGEGACKNCSVLRNEIDKRTLQLENSNAQQLAGFLTLKQKIIGTDKLIREYQSSKVECDILTRKNEEFVHLIDQLHQDLNTRNQEYAKVYGSIELLKKANADYEMKFEELNDEAQKWKSQAEAGENFTSQLVAKVKVLEKYEEEVKQTASVTRECEKLENKVKVMKGQLKEAREMTNKSKKETNKLQKEYNLLVKYAKQWGEMIEEQGKFNTYQQKFYSKLCNGESREGDDVDQDDIEANETDMQSKLLEQLLGEGDRCDSTISPPDILPSDTELLKCSRQSPGKILSSNQVKQTRIRAQRRGSQDNATPSVMHDKTPTHSPLTRKRTRTLSQNSITTTSDADTATESEKEYKKHSGPRTRSSRLKMTSLSELKGPEPIPTSDPMNVIDEKALPELIADIPSQSAISNIFQLDPTPVKPIAEQQYSNKKEHVVSSDSESQLKLSTKSSGDVAIPVQSTSLFEFESSSDSDMEIIPVPNCKLRDSSGIDISCSSINRVPCSIFALEADLDMSSSESEAEVPIQKKTLDFDTEAVGTSQVEKMSAEQSEETPETELMAVLNMAREASPLPLEKNIESANASSEEVSPTESETPEPSEENEEFNSNKNHIEEMPSEQADRSLNHESGQMTVNEKTQKVFSLEETFSLQPEEESISDDVDKLSSTKSPIEIQVTKLTEEDQSDDLKMAINIGKRLACAEIVAASSEKIDNQFSAEVGKQKSVENRNQVSEAIVIDDKTEKLSNSFSDEIENPKSNGDVAGFSENSEKELRVEDVIVPLSKLQDDQSANVQSSNTNQFNQDIIAVVSEKPEKEFPTKLQEDQLAIADSVAEFSTESLSVETGLVVSEEDNHAFEVVTISGECQEKLFASEIEDPLEMLQEDSSPNVEECSLQVETEVLKPVQDIQKSLPVVSGQFETGLSKPMENNEVFQAMDSDEPEKELPIKPQENQLAVADSSAEFSTTNFSVESGLVESNESNQAFGVVTVSDKCQERLFVSEIDENSETLQEDSMPNIQECSMQVETRKPVENIKESQPLISDQPEKELLHEVENLLDKPEQIQRSIVDSNVELLNQTFVVSTDGSKKNIQDFEAAEVDNKCDEETLENKSQLVVSNQPEKELPRGMEDLLDKPEHSQQSIFDIESFNQPLVIDTGGPKKNIRDFGAAEADDKCNKQPVEDNKKSQPEVSDHLGKKLLREVEEKTERGHDHDKSNVKSLNQTLVVDTSGPKENIQDSGAAVVDDRGDEELFNSKAIDPAEKLQEAPQMNVVESSGKSSPSKVETEVLKDTNDLEFEVLKSSNNKLPIEIEKQANHETESVFKIIEFRKEMGTHLDKQEVQSIPVIDSFSEKSITDVNVEPGIVTDFEAVQELPTIPTVEETVSPDSPQIIKQAISGQISESSRPMPSKENREIGSSHQSGDKPLIPAQLTPLSLTDNTSGNRNAYPSLFNPSAIPRQIITERNNSSMIDLSKSPMVSRNLETPSAFKVPRVPSTPPRVPDVNLHSNFPWSRSISHGVKRTAVDDEVAVILKQIRTNIIELPTTISPLPKSPEPQPIVPKKIEEPKSRFPVLPRCAFNWTGKKLPISDKLTERFGGYLHPGVHVRVRFRKVGRRLRDMRSPDILSHCFQGVTNFVEAERRPKPILSPVPFIEDVADEVEPEKKIPEPSDTQSRKLSERRPLIPNSLFSTQSVTNIDVHKKNSRSSITAKGTTPVSRSKVPDLFGSDSSSSESECELDTARPPNQECSSRSSVFAVPSPIQECLKRPPTTKNLKEKQPEPGSGSKQSSQLSNSSRTQALAQLAEPIIPLGRGSRNDSFMAAKKNELRRDLESPTTDQTRYGFGLGRGVKTHRTISPCSESLLSAVSKAKTPLGRVVAPVKRSFRQPEVSNAPVVKTPYLPDSSSPLNEGPFRKRVSHTLKRSLELDAADPSVLQASKRGRILPETPPAPSPPTPVPDKVELEEIPITAKTRTRQKWKTSCPIKLQEMVTDVKKTPSRNEKLRQKTAEKSPNNAIKRFERLVVENSTSESENEMEVNTDETGQSSTSEKEERSLNSDKSDSCDSSNEKGRSPISPQSPHAEESTEPPEMEESSKLSDVDESPKSPYVEESPKSPDNDESPKSPDEKSLDEHESSNAKTVVEIPISSPTQSEQHQPSAFELVYNDLQKAPLVQPKGKQAKGNNKLKKEIKFVVLKFFKDPEVVDEFLCRLIERVLQPDSMNNPSFFIRNLITTVIHGWDDLIDTTNTPPAPPMAGVHQRCVIVLQKLDEANAKKQVEPSVNPNMISDLFLSESSATMFKTEQTLTLEEMCSLSRAYTAVCRSRGCLAKARAFLFDCVYFMPPRSYALTYTIMTVWADVLRQVSFPLGTSCVDQTIAYCLLHNCKVKAVQGISGKVIQARTFLQNVYEYKNTTRTVDDLVEYLMNRFYETNSRDEASSLSWSLALLVRWEGVDFAIQLIEKKLWPFLRRWSSGEGTNNAAAAVIITIGMVGKTVPASKRGGVKSVLDAMKTLLQSEGVVPPIQEAAIEGVIHLGETDDPKSIIEMVKSWKIESAYLSQHMRVVLKAFLKRHSDLCVV